MWLSNSSVGKKVVMSLTGLFLILFVTFHVLMNAVALISPDGYDAVCHFLGANWYALAGTLVLAGGFIIHILYSFWLSLENKKARGNDPYAVNKRPKSVEWASQNMLVLGIIVVCFLIVHLIQFWYRMQWQEIIGSEYMHDGAAVPPAQGSYFLYLAFKDWWTVAIYLIGFAALWFHMSHGFWSALQSLGTNNDVWMKRLRTVAVIWATTVCLLFAVEAVAFSLFANCPAYVEQVKAKASNPEATISLCGASTCSETVNVDCDNACESQGCNK